jgi:tRNA nucleotidyltransferase/poly(A) polymerase
MPDYIYLLENRLSADQQNALRQLREVAREAGTILFLIGDAVRDLTSGHAVRELEVAVHGNALKLKKTIEKIGGNVWGEDEASRSLYLCFPGTVRVDLVSTHRVEYPKPGKPVYHPASIQEDLRRRDFTVNAMAISLNEGSFGLLMDPMNGAADIESRTLRLVSNYGFLEEPSLLIRATRYIARLGWEMDPRTRTRCDNARAEGVIEHLSAQARSRELEQIGHEEDGLKVLRAFEAEGWMKVLFPAWTAVKADEEKLTALHELAVELLLQGVHADMSAAQMRLLTAKLAPKDLTALKKLMLRPGFVEEWNSLDALAAGFARVLLSGENAAPSASFKLFTSYDPEAILWLGFTSDDPAVKERFNLFLKVWPEVRQRIPHALLQEMRITAELPAYREIVQAVFLELLDGKLGTPEEARAFLEPHSPPAPPPKETIKRPRVKRGSEAKLQEPSFDDDESEERLEDDEDLDDIGGDDLDLDLHLPKIELDVELIEDSDAAAEEEEEEEDLNPEPALQLAPMNRALKPPAQPKLTRPVPLPAGAAPFEAEKPDVASAAPKPEEAEEPAALREPEVEPQPEPKPAPASTVGPLSKPALAKAPPAQVKEPALPAKPAPSEALAKPPAKLPAQHKQTKPAPLSPAAALVDAEKLAAAPAASTPGKADEPAPGLQPTVESQPAPQANPALTAAGPPAARAKPRPAPAKTPPAQAKELVPQRKPAPPKALAKASAKPQTKAAQKPQAKAPAKSRVKISAKAPAKTPAPKFTPAKRNPVPARSPKSANAAKPSKAAIRKPVLKPAKKR